MRDSSVEATSPAIREIASPWKIGSNKITLAPTTTAAAVSSIGRKRSAPASTTACSSVMPCSRRSSMKSTRMIEFLTMMPTAAKPIIDVAVKNAPISACAGVIGAANFEPHRILESGLRRRRSLCQRFLARQGRALAAAAEPIELQLRTRDPVVRARPAHRVAVLFPASEGVQPRTERRLRHRDILRLRAAFRFHSFQVGPPLHGRLLQLVDVGRWKCSLLQRVQGEILRGENLLPQLRQERRTRLAHRRQCRSRVGQRRLVQRGLVERHLHRFGQGKRC